MTPLRDRRLRRLGARRCGAVLPVVQRCTEEDHGRAPAHERHAARTGCAMAEQAPRAPYGWQHDGNLVSGRRGVRDSPGPRRSSRFGPPPSPRRLVVRSKRRASVAEVNPPRSKPSLATRAAHVLAPLGVNRYSPATPWEVPEIGTYCLLVPNSNDFTSADWSKLELAPLLPVVSTSVRARIPSASRPYS